MKKILILGAGVYQVPLITTAKRLGIQTIVASIPGNYPGFALADKIYYENTTDYEKILEIASKAVKEIIISGIDSAMNKYNIKAKKNKKKDPEITENAENENKRND